MYCRPSAKFIRCLAISLGYFVGQIFCYLYKISVRFRVPTSLGGLWAAFHGILYVVYPPLCAGVPLELRGTHGIIPFASRTVTFRP